MIVERSVILFQVLLKWWNTSFCIASDIDDKLATEGSLTTMWWKKDLSRGRDGCSHAPQSVCRGDVAQGVRASRALCPIMGVAGVPFSRISLC